MKWGGNINFQPQALSFSNSVPSSPADFHVTCDLGSLRFGVRSASARTGGSMETFARTCKRRGSWGKVEREGKWLKKLTSLTWLLICFCKYHTISYFENILMWLTMEYVKLTLRKVSYHPSCVIHQWKSKYIKFNTIFEINHPINMRFSFTTGLSEKRQIANMEQMFRRTMTKSELKCIFSHFTIR